MVGIAAAVGVVAAFTPGCSEHTIERMTMVSTVIVSGVLGNAMNDRTRSQWTPEPPTPASPPK